MVKFRSVLLLMLERKIMLKKPFKQSPQAWLHRFITIGLFWAIVFGLSACSSGEDSLSVGDDAPEFTAAAADGRMISLGDYVGKQPVLLFFHMAVG
jgi:hypothetical protein